MKRIAFLMVTLLLMSGVAMAQGPRGGKKMGPKERAEKMTERMAREYSLNDTQKKQLLELNMAQVEKMTPAGHGIRDGKKVCAKDSCQCKDHAACTIDGKSCKKDAKDSSNVDKVTKRDGHRVSGERRRKMYDERKAVLAAYDAQLKKIMTKEQYETYSKKQAERRSLEDKKVR